MSGSQFLLESQARTHAQENLQLLRAHWVSRILGEPAHNDRKSDALYQMVKTCSTAVSASTPWAFRAISMSTGLTIETASKGISGASKTWDRRSTSSNWTSAWEWAAKIRVDHSFGIYRSVLENNMGADERYAPTALTALLQAVERGRSPDPLRGIGP
jgi:hypothetical protein